MKDPNRAELIEALTGAFRAREPFGVVRFHPAFYDLDAEARVEAARVAFTQRRLEAALDPEGLSTTGRAVLARIGKADED